MSGRRFTDSEEIEIGKLYREFSLRRIARAYQVSIMCIKRCLKRRNVPPHKPGWVHLFKPAEEEEICKIYGEFSLSKIAKAYRVSVSCVKGCIKRRGVPLRRRGGIRLLKPTEEKEVWKIYTAGRVSVGHIAEAYGRSPGVIRKAVMRYGEIRSRSEAGSLAKPIGLIVQSNTYPQFNVIKLSERVQEIALPMSIKQNQAGGYHVAVHRLVMAMHLRRPLLPSETVHHRDGNKKNYRFRNLRLLTSKRLHPTGFGDPFYQKWQEALAKIRSLEQQLSRQGAR